MSDIYSDYLHKINRRHFLSKASLGLGGLALGSLFGCSSGKNESAMDLSGKVLNSPHFAPKAKRIIYLFQSGGPSQIDLFDYKPLLMKMRGEDLPIWAPICTNCTFSCLSIISNFSEQNF